jgi:hypothetical protein
MTELQERIYRLENDLEIHKLYAQWWIARATTGETKTRIMSHLDSISLTDEEKVKDALNTADSHIRILPEIVETIIKLSRDEEVV